MRVKFYPVRLQKGDTCLTYVFKRLGLSPMLIMDSEFIDERFSRVDEAPQPGDVLMFTNRERYAILPDEITEDGKILSHKRLLLRHFAVVEYNGLVSDCTVSSNDYPMCKTIRMRRLEEVLPDNPVCLRNKLCSP